VVASGGEEEPATVSQRRKKISDESVDPLGRTGAAPFLFVGGHATAENRAVAQGAGFKQQLMADDVKPLAYFGERTDDDTKHDGGLTGCTAPPSSNP